MPYRITQWWLSCIYSPITHRRDFTRRGWLSLRRLWPQMTITVPSVWNSFLFILKLFKIADVTVLSSRACQMLMIRSAKKCFLKSVLNIFLCNFLECGPCVLSLVAYRIQRNGQSWFQKYHSQFYKLQSSLHGVFLPSSINVILSAAARKANSSIREQCV